MGGPQREMIHHSTPVSPGNYLFQNIFTNVFNLIMSWGILCEKHFVFFAKLNTIFYIVLKIASYANDRLKLLTCFILFVLNQTNILFNMPVLNKM